MIGRKTLHITKDGDVLKIRRLMMSSYLIPFHMPVKASLRSTLRRESMNKAMPICDRFFLVVESTWKKRIRRRDLFLMKCSKR